MNWLREKRNRSLIVSGACALGALWFCLLARSKWNAAAVGFANGLTERNRLERLVPYPSKENLKRMQAETASYEFAVKNLKKELRGFMLPYPPLIPSEFQSALRVSMNAVSEKARGRGVKLPNRFCLGLDEFTAALPSEKAAPLLGRELSQIEWITGLLIDAPVDAIVSLRRSPLPEEPSNPVVPGSSPSRREAKPTKPTGEKLISRNTIDLTFVSNPTAVRKVLNQIASAASQFCIVRQLHVRSEREKGPARDVINKHEVGSKSSAPAESGSINFIVGEERIETMAVIEFVTFTD